MCEYSPPLGSTHCSKCDAPKVYCVCQLCEMTYEDTTRAVLHEMMELRRTEAATARRWTPALQIARDVVTSSGSHEFDALALTADMVEEFLDMSDVENNSDADRPAGLQAVGAPRDYIDPETGMICVARPPVVNATWRLDGVAGAGCAARRPSSSARLQATGK